MRWPFYRIGASAGYTEAVKPEPDDFEAFMRNTRQVMGILFTADRVQMWDEEIMGIFAESYK